MLSSAKQSIKRMLHAMGIEAHRYHPSTSPLARLMAALRAHEIDLVFDIGANEGQFARELRAGGFSGRIVSFEPLTSAHNKLSKASRGDPSWQVHQRYAIGDHLGEVQINIAGNSVSSSILPMLAAHSSAAPESVYQTSETTPLTTLDRVVGQYLNGAKAPFLKIDTQGYEWFVLDGASTALSQVRGVLMELSSTPLYEGQHLWQESIERLQKEGFTLWSLQPVFIDQSNGRTLQWDGLFFRQ